MGTNFYLLKSYPDHGNNHIGKRSAAGLYCWDCEITLCMGGESQVHMGSSGWEKRCPKCGKGQEHEPLEQSAVGRELGFNDGEPKKKTGVKGCASFSWDIAPEEIEKLLNVQVTCPYCDSELPPGKVVVDEYGKEYTWKEFQDILSECPIRFTGSIGRGFC